MTNDSPLAYAPVQTGQEEAPAPLPTSPVDPMPTRIVERIAVPRQRTHAANAPVNTEYTLPEPPNDDEKYAYLGGQRRWVLVLMAVSYGIILSTVLRFALIRPETYPYLVVVFVTVLASAIGLVTGLRKRKFNLAQHQAKVNTWNPAVMPSIDVFLPSAGEPINVLRNTFKHVARMTWSGPLTVHVLDDSGSEDVRLLANEYGFTYLVRPNRGHLKKAGNLLYGYQNSTHDLIVVFDADFAPRPDFLKELVPYFDDEKTGIVQSPQYFDTDKRMSWLQRGAGSTQEFFYRWVQPARNAVGAAICVGTNAIYRRKALDAAGGFAQIGHSEDVHTGVNLKKAGYVTQYVQVLVAKGLCPDTLDGFLNQQYRWCTGSMSLLKDTSFHKAPLSRFQKLCFWSGFTYYLTTALFVFTTPLPTMAMLWLMPGYVTPINYLPMIPGVLMVLWITPKLFHSNWKFEVLRVQQAYSYAHALAVWHTLRGRTASWVPTGAAGKGTPLATKVKRLMLFWISVTQVGLWGGLLYASLTHGLVDHIPGFFLTAFTTLIQVPLLLKVRTPQQKKERRAELAANLRRTVLRRTSRRSAV